MKYGKQKLYWSVHLPSDVVETIVAEMLRRIIKDDDLHYRTRLRISLEDEDTFIEHAEEMTRRKAFEGRHYSFNIFNGPIFFEILREGNRFTIKTDGFDKIEDAERPMRFLDDIYERHKVAPEEGIRDVSVFIGHGRSRAWRDLKDHLVDLHGVRVTAYETGARAGLTIQEVLGEMASNTSMAFLVLTGEDVDREGAAHARENVVHETGLFQGKLGFKKAIVLLEDGCHEFTNIAGLQQIRFGKGNIRETFGDAIATLQREFATPRRR